MAPHTEPEPLWHYVVGGAQIGPLSRDDFYSAISSGVVTDATLVWRAGLASWQPARELTELAEVRQGARQPGPHGPLMADRNAEIRDLTRRLGFLDQEVVELRAALARLAAAESPEAPAPSVPTVTAQPAMRTSADSEPLAAATPPDDAHIHQQSRGDAVADAAAELTTRRDDRAPMEVVAAAPSAQSLLRTAADRIDAVVALLLGPFGTLLEQLTSVYRHYRAQGKAAVFLLTVAGLVAFTAGFGYLLQYSFNSFLGPIAKLAIGFLSGTAIIGLGAFLFRRNPRMQDYASAIIGLGVVVLYLCAYFTGPYYGLTDAAGSFALFAGAVAAGYFLALIFETRVVAVITLAGGIASPWTLTDPNAIADSYALFLALLTLGSLHLGQRIRWVALSRFVFVSTALVLEYLALESSTQPAILMAAMHAHLYLFFYYLLFQGRTLVDRPDRVALTMLAAEIALVILIASQVIGDATMLGAVLGANAVVLGAPFFMRFTRGGDARVVFLLAAGALLGYGILAIFSLDYLGLLWGIEAVALLYVGLRFASVSIRVEGMLLLGLSAVSSTYAGSIWLIGSGWSLAPPWVSLVGLVVYLEAFGRLLRGGYALSAIEQRIPRWLDEVEAVIGALVWAGLVLVLRPDLLAVAAIAPLFAMLYFASLRKLHLAQAFALAHMGFFVYAVVDAGQSLNLLT